jgi:hypothetical protein
MILSRPLEKGKTHELDPHRHLDPVAPARHRVLIDDRQCGGVVQQRGHV